MRCWESCRVQSSWPQPRRRRRWARPWCWGTGSGTQPPHESSLQSPARCGPPRAGPRTLRRTLRTKSVRRRRRRSQRGRGETAWRGRERGCARSLPPRPAPPPPPCLASAPRRCCSRGLRRRVGPQTQMQRQMQMQMRHLRESGCPEADSKLADTALRALRALQRGALLGFPHAQGLSDRPFSLSAVAAAPLWSRTRRTAPPPPQGSRPPQRTSCRYGAAPLVRLAEGAQPASGSFPRKRPCGASAARLHRAQPPQPAQPAEHPSGLASGRGRWARGGAACYGDF